ncbi:helix-turn-helix domain-containing protein [Cohnella sp. JJ-181]|uniref:helix-turn-helix domain-containing protein n=1 Tax=Cohnella rhizoplanae TaxID=2974897 RepID=UPI0022FF914A|nr:helix-turn-helix domain-containing protein [Cohnella sp. JJ-181]CAI6085509.1 HTH-type transcriptional activator RhaR [Cohnella sp. JJ-181]
MRTLFKEDLRPWLVSHRYWHEKKAFLLREDTYPHWTVFAVEDGLFSFEINGAKGTAGRGDLVLCPPSVPFIREAIAPVSFHFILFDWSDDTGDVLSGELPMLETLLSIKDSGRLSSTYLRLRKWNGAEHALAVRSKRHLLADLWLMYLEEADGGVKLPAESDERSSMMLQAKRIIRENAFAASSFNLKMLAARFGLSQVQFTRSFRRATGHLPREYLISVRLHKVQSLLLESELTLGQIAEACGYENEFYLSRIFTKRLGVSPSRFRRLNRL